MSVPRLSKTITTYFFPVGDDFRTVVDESVIFLQRAPAMGARVTRQTL